MARRYFVTVLSDDPRALRALGKHGFDLFQATAKKTREGGGSIEGLVTLEEVEQLVEDGFKVLIEEESSKRARATETVEFAQWLKEMGV